ncbi:TPA: single-stranded DNA-binding protein [Pasteurella multocida]|nr:single-stranded DNA-binding protein [Pasteurella multocida]
MKHGFYMVGKMLGSRQLQNIDKSTGEVKFKNQIGIGVMRSDGFGGTTQDEILITVSKNELFTNELITSCKNLTGKLVKISVYPMPWSFNSKNGISYYYNEHSFIEEVK